MSDTSDLSATRTSTASASRTGIDGSGADGSGADGSGADEYKPYPRERTRNPFIGGKMTVLGVSFHGGRILSASQLDWFTVLPPKGFGVLTTTGRKSGKKRRKCVRAIRRGEQVYIVSIGGARAAWLKNLQADPRVSLRIRGGRFKGSARELGEGPEVEPAKTAYCETVNPFDYAECALWRRGRPSRARIVDLHRGWFKEGTPLVVELER
jgi:deazaflavin-dependent oxidoreductase (nitroreductase family)